MTRAFSVLALALFAGLGWGCGPVQYMAQMGGPTSTALTQCENEGAEANAPYEYTAAVEYLKKARDEASRSQFQTAIEYGKSAEEYANKARALSRERKSGARRPAKGDPAAAAGTSGGDGKKDADKPAAAGRRPDRERGSR